MQHMGLLLHDSGADGFCTLFGYIVCAHAWDMLCLFVLGSDCRCMILGLEAANILELSWAVFAVFGPSRGHVMQLVLHRVQVLRKMRVVSVLLRHPLLGGVVRGVLGPFWVGCLGGFWGHTRLL
jgi:hypothetical protein